MKGISIQLRVHGHPVLDQSTRAALRSEEAFKQLPLRRAEQVWGGPVPSQVCFLAVIRGAAIFVTEDWEVSIRSGRLLDCVGAIVTMVTALVQLLGKPVEIALLETDQQAHDNHSNTLYRLLNQERNIRRVGSLGFWVLTLVAGGLLGAAIQWLLLGGS